MIWKIHCLCASPSPTCFLPYPPPDLLSLTLIPAASYRNLRKLDKLFELYDDEANISLQMMLLSGKSNIRIVFRAARFFSAPGDIREAAEGQMAFRRKWQFS